VASLKLCLSNIEKIDHKIPTSLFSTISSQTPMDDTVRVSILAYPGLGCTPNEQIALVAMFSGACRSAPIADTPEKPLLSQERTTSLETRYVYYRLYAEDGAIPSANPVHSDNLYLGRIPAELVTPPHTAASLRRCLSNVENIDDKISTTLFIAASSRNPMDDTGHLSILADPGPGCTPNEPIALVAKFSVANRSSPHAMTPEIALLSSQEGSTPLETRYVYYRLYAEDGAIPSMNPVYSDDPYLGSIPATLVVPPHTAASLKRCLSNVEKIDDKIPTTLFIATSSQNPMDDNDHLSIFADPGPGCTPNEPMALVAKLPDVGRRSLDTEAVSLSQESTSPFEKQYLYYQVYKAHGAIPSKQPADSNDPFVGRISIDSIPPPHTAATILRCISKAEELPNSRKSQLFTSISSESPIGDAHVSMLTGDRPGSTPDDPMAFLVSKFAGQIRVTGQHIYGQTDPNWLTCTVGEILDITHEEPRNQTYIQNGARFKAKQKYPAYEAMNNAGKVGFVYAPAATPC
jgi:hypothetical protein